MGRAIDVRSAPARTGKFEWLDDNVVQWVPDRFWPAHSTVALSWRAAHELRNGPAVVGVADIATHLHREHRWSPGGTGRAATNAAPRPHWGEEGVLPASMGRPSSRRPSAPTT
ncbi:putative secreted protein [Mycobacterium kansasii]|uniref:Putative secreted protein n=1 Tax=Mycobacterium kansasii TaxID=1768 RepID=A0A1V3W944_MYCKA|nr:putative secreted protein [Mycobacterium kansasii]